MSNNFKKVLYFGSCDHIEVVEYFPKCNEFILIDTQPRSEHDAKDYFYDGFYRVKFINKIKNKCKKYGFILNKITELDSNFMSKELVDNFPYINPHLFIFNNSNRIIKYYVSTNILYNMNKMLEDDIKSSDTLYVAGYSPDIELLKYLNKQINFVGDNHTIYFYEREPDENNIISNYIENKIILYDYFDNYYLVWREKSLIIVCDSLEDINNKKNELNEIHYNDNL
jgi:hypothetical protein